MADKDKNDLADALARLAAGEHVEEPHDPDASHHGHDSIEPPPKIPPKPAQPQFRQTPGSPARPAGANPPPPAQKPATAPANRTVAPGQMPARPAAPAARPAAPIASASTEPAAPVAKRPATPTARPATPAAPNLTPPEDLPPVDPTPDTQDAVDDDAMLAPAPDASVFAPKPRPAPRKARPPIFKTLEFRQTVIPIMLTTGSIMIIFSILPVVMGPDSAFADLYIWLQIAMALFGLMLLGLAALNMMQVKKELEERRAGKASTRTV